MIYNVSVPPLVSSEPFMSSDPSTLDQKNHNHEKDNNQSAPKLPDIVAFLNKPNPPNSGNNIHNVLTNKQEESYRNQDAINVPQLPTIEQFKALRDELVQEKEKNKMNLNPDCVITSPLNLENLALINRVSINKTSPMMIDKTSDNRKWKCEYCRKWVSYINDEKVILHLLQHEKERKFKCEFCSKIFRRKSDVDRHIRIHSGIKPHKCNICGKGFGTKYCLKTHYRCHTGEMPYKCHYKNCNKTFRQNSHLVVHWRTHTGDKPYQCKICLKRFTQHSTLSVHSRIHIKNGKPFICPCCQREFTQRHSLQRHIKNVHKKYYKQNGYHNIYNLETMKKMKEKNIIIRKMNNNQENNQENKV